MKYETFKGEFSVELEDILEHRGYEAELVSYDYGVTNKQVDGMVIRLDGAEIAPSIHTEAIYERFASGDYTIHELAEHIADSTEMVYEDIHNMSFQAVDFTAEYIKENATISVVNKELNKELLFTVLHEDVRGTDLSVVAKIQVDDVGTITITNEHAGMFQMTGSEILDAAWKNTEERGFSIHSMQDTLQYLLPKEMEHDFGRESTPSILVISNETGIDGASAILSKETLNEACEILRTNKITLLPSSRNELIAVNSEVMDIESTADLKELVEEINSTILSPEEILSNNIYHYDGLTRELEMCNEQGLFKESLSDELTMEELSMEIGGF